MTNSTSSTSSADGNVQTTPTPRGEVGPTQASGTTANTQPSGEQGSTPPSGEQGQGYPEAAFRERLERERKKLEKEFDKRLEERLEREKLGETERLQKDLDDARKELELARNEARRATLKSRVARDVTDPDYALFILERDRDLLDDDGNPIMDALLERAPVLRPSAAQPTTSNTPRTPASAGSPNAPGGPREPASLEEAINQHLNARPRKK